MTWTWIDDGFTDRLEVMTLSDSAFRLHVEALVYCNRNGRDGVITAPDLARLGRPDSDTVDELVQAALWETKDDAWQLDWSDQQTAEQVEDRRATWRKRDERRRAHNKGDHSLCDPARCWALKGETSLTRESQRETTSGSRPSRSRSLSHSPKEWERGDAEGGSARATPPRRRGGKCPHGVTNGIARGQCPEDQCTDEFEQLQGCAAGRCHTEKELGADRCSPGSCWLRDEWPAERDIGDGEAS